VASRFCKTTHDMLGGALLACSWIPFTIIYTYINANVRISAHRSFSAGTMIVARAFPDHPRNQPRGEIATFEVFGEPVVVANSLLRARSHTVRESVSHVCAPACSCLWFFPGFAATRELARTLKSNPTSFPLPYTSPPTAGFARQQARSACGTTLYGQLSLQKSCPEY
jgi:hypothetical protein